MKDENRVVVVLRDQVREVIAQQPTSGRINLDHSAKINQWIGLPANGLSERSFVESLSEIADAAKSSARFNKGAESRVPDPYLRAEKKLVDTATIEDHILGSEAPLAF